MLRYAVVNARQDKIRDYRWEEYHAATLPERGDIYVSLQVNSSGQTSIAMNAAAYKRFGSPEYVTLLYEPNHEMIGLRTAERLTPGAARLKGYMDNRAYRIAATAFMKHYSIRVDRTVRFTDPKFCDNLMILDLHQTAPAPNARKA